MVDRERLVRFDGGAFAKAAEAAMRTRRVSINALAAETLVPYQTCWRLVTGGNVRNIEAIHSVADHLGINVSEYLR